MKILEDLLDKNINNGDALGRYLFNQNYNSQINLEKVNSYIEKFYQSYKKENLNIIEEIRGQGFLLGIKCNINNSILIKALRTNGLLVISASENVIRLLPPLNINKKEIIEAIKILKQTFKKLSLGKK